MNREIIKQLLNRPQDGNKYTFGHTLIVGGSPGMVGAPLLSGKAALRAGAGLVTIASEDLVIDKLENRVEEIMTLRLPKASGEANAVLQKFITERKVTAMVLGPGMQPSVQLGNLVEKLIEQQHIPIIIDGGALGALHDAPEALLRERSQAVILTPHLGEFKRLVNIKLPEARDELKPIVIQFATEAKVHLVLKGSPTYVSHPDGRLYENPTGNPGLATAGTGDVLTGIIAGIISQGITPADAVELAVYIHGLAGDITAAEKTQPGMIASDVIEAIPEAYHESSF